MRKGNGQFAATSMRGAPHTTASMGKKSGLVQQVGVKVGASAGRDVPKAKASGSAKAQRDYGDK